ncbi:phage tail protein [Salmonella enterica]|nr:hypothetical protein [Salmonella enterica subsp. enterica]EJI7809672.1 phage tail protein [Salmonella enterica]
MSQTAITLAFEQWKAQQGATGEPVLLDEFVFANVPGLNIDAPIDRNETLPPAAQIVYRQPVTRTGVVNENGVVFSAVLGADVGDFSFNWIGLLNKATGTLAMIVHAPLQQKLKTAAGQQGNVLTRSFLMEYNGAQTETGITTPAETWQIDFTARMAGMDERQRLENVDIFGAAAFFGDGYLVAKTGNQYFVTKGAGYVAGLRASLAANQNITVTTKPVKVWLDVCWTGSLTSVWGVQTKITVAADLANYVQNGVQHYVFAVGSIDADGVITDLRPKGTLNEQTASDALKKHEQSRNHPDATTSAKGFTQLSSATDSTSEALAATPKAVKAAYDLASGKYTAQDASTTKKGLVQLSSATDNVSEILAATPKAVKAANDNANGRVPSGRKVNGHALSADINLSASDVKALALTGGGLTGPVAVLNQNGKRLQLENAGNPAQSIYVVLTGTEERPVLVEYKDDTSYHFFSQRNTDGSITFQTAGKLLPGDYANFDSRYQPKGSYAYKGDSYTKSETYSKSEVYSKSETNEKFKNAKISGVGPFSFLDKTSGLIVKAGGITFASDGDRVLFPEAFPNICRAVLLTLNGTAGETNRNIVTTNVSRSGFNIAHGANETGVFWIAIGI